MSEIYLGDLSKEKLFDILKPLLTGKKTGRMVLKGKENGEICLEKGNIIHAKTYSTSGDSAFFEIMGWKTGRITFEPDFSPKERTILNPTEQLLLNWSYRKQELEKIREVVSSPHATFRLSLQKNPEDRNVNADQWSVLALSNGTKTVSEIAKTLQWDEYKTSKTIYQLVQTGLLEKAGGLKPPEKIMAEEDFFQIVEIELKKVMGPVASFILDDKLLEFKEAKDTFPKDQLLPFVEALAEEIPNPFKKNVFLRGMKEFLNQKGVKRPKT
jgi:hypothetical protein